MLRCLVWPSLFCQMSLSVPSPVDQSFPFPSKCLHSPMAFPYLRCVFPARVEAHTVICEFTDNTEHICFSESLSPLKQDELSGVAVALQSSQ